jgi:hypothetical protein
MLGGTGTLLGLPPNTQFKRVVELIYVSLPLFADSAIKDNITNENGLNRRLARFITNVSGNRNLPYFANSESMEDETKGTSPSTDIGIYLKIDDIANIPPIITVFEGKRLTTHLGSKRRREYVIGHEKDGKYIQCGGIERFKWSIHGGNFKNAGMIGYIQDRTPEHWRDQINSWISELSSKQHDPTWFELERLTQPTTEGRVTKCSSVVYRKTEELLLTHLWINLERKK